MSAAQAFQSFDMVFYHSIPEKQGQIAHKTRGLTSALVRETIYIK